MITANGDDVTNRISQLSVRGKEISVPSVEIDGLKVNAVGRFLRIATIWDEEWLELGKMFEPIGFVNALQESNLKADVFAFSGSLESQDTPLKGRVEIDNVAVVRTDDYKAWWDGLPQVTRKNTRRAAKKGIEVHTAKLDDDFVRGIKAIYDETPIRQGRRFWHYGKDLDVIKRENSSYQDRCELLGAYFSGELVGFIKFVYVGESARIMQIICMDAHQDKRPIVALIEQAVSICHQKGIKYLIYGKYTYGKKKGGGIVEFKQRLGFQQVDFPRYYVPLSLRGRIGLLARLHLGVIEILPARLTNQLLAARTKWLRWRGA